MPRSLRRALDGRKLLFSPDLGRAENYAQLPPSSLATAPSPSSSLTWYAVPAYQPARRGPAQG